MFTKICCLYFQLEQALLALGSFFRQTAHVLDQFRKLIVRELAAIGRHLVFAFFCDFQKFGIRLFLDFRACEILHGKFLAGYAARGVRPMADLAFHLVQGLE